MLSRLARLGAPLRRRDVRLIWGAQAISQFGDWAARIALALLVYERTDSALLSAAVTTAGLLPWLGVGQVLATAADRYTHQHVVIACHLFRAAMYGLLALTVAPVWVVLVVVFLAGLADPPEEAAAAAALPQLAEEGYPQALALSEVTHQSATLIGLAAGGLLTAGLGGQQALGLNAASFVLAAGLIWWVRRTRSNEPGEAIGSAIASLRAGGRALAGDPLVLRAAVVVTAGAAGTVAAEATVAVLASELGVGAAGAGALAMVMPIAALLAVLFFPEGGGWAMVRWVSIITVVMTTVMALGYLLSSVGVALLAVAAAGVGLAAAGSLQTLTVPAGAVIGPRLPQQHRGSAFSLLQGSLQFTMAIAALIAGALAGAFGVATAVAVAAVPTIVVAVLIGVQAQVGLRRERTEVAAAIPAQSGPVSAEGAESSFSSSAGDEPAMSADR